MYAKKSHSSGVVSCLDDHERPLLEAMVRSSFNINCDNVLKLFEDCLALKTPSVRNIATVSIGLNVKNRNLWARITNKKGRNFAHYLMEHPKALREPNRVEQYIDLIIKLLTLGGKEWVINHLRSTNADGCSLANLYVSDLGQGLLHLAAEEGEVDLVSVLLAAGADVTLKDSDGHLPWQLAFNNGYTELADLLRGTGPNLAEQILKANGVVEKETAGIDGSQANSNYDRSKKALPPNYRDVFRDILALEEQLDDLEKQSDSRLLERQASKVGIYPVPHQVAIEMVQVVDHKIGVRQGINIYPPPLVSSAQSRQQLQKLYAAKVNAQLAQQQCDQEEHSAQPALAGELVGNTFTELQSRLVAVQSAQPRQVARAATQEVGSAEQPAFATVAVAAGEGVVGVQQRQRRAQRRRIREHKFDDRGEGKARAREVAFS